MTAPRRWHLVDSLLAVALALAAFTTRAAVRTTAYYSVDAGLLATAALDYDFGDNRPHPPYYPLVVAALRLLSPVLEPLPALTWLAIAACAAMVAGTYAVAWWLRGRPAGLLAAAIVLLSPVALHNGAVPLSYALEGAASTGVALAALWCRDRPGRRTAIALGVAASLAVGIRPSSAVLLAPMVLWAILPRWRVAGWTVAAGAVATAAWLLPALAAGGGLDDFLFGVRYQSEVYILADTVWRNGWPAVQDHADWLAHHLRREMPFLAAVVAAGAIGVHGVVSHWPHRHVGLVTCWILPGVLFYVLVYAGWPVLPDGYVVALLPGFALLASFVLLGLWRTVRSAGVPGPAKAVATAAVVAIAAMPLTWVAQWDDVMRPARDAEAWEASLRGLEEEFPAHDTAVLAFITEPWLSLEHPGYLVWTVQIYGEDGAVRYQVQQAQHGRADKGFFDNLADGPDDPSHAIPDWVERVVVVTGHPTEPPATFLISGADARTTTLASGATLTWFARGAFTHIEQALVLEHMPLGPVPTRGAPPNG